MADMELETIKKEKNFIVFNKAKSLVKYGDFNGADFYFSRIKGPPFDEKYLELKKEIGQGLHNNLQFEIDSYKLKGNRSAVKIFEGKIKEVDERYSI